jgi:hypothetical protein
MAASSRTNMVMVYGPTVTNPTTLPYRDVLRRYVVWQRRTYGLHGGAVPRSFGADAVWQNA